MKKILLGIALLMATAAGYAQTTVVSGQILDPASNPYRNAVVTVDFINNSSLIAKWNNFPLTVTTWTTNADSNGNFSQALPDLNFIGPATGTFYNFRICANTLVPPGQPTNPCFTYASPACPNVGCITGATITITAAIQAVSLPVPNALLTNVVTNPNGPQVISNQPLTLSGAAATLTVPTIDKTVFVDGTTYALTNAGITSALTAACNGTVPGKVVLPPVNIGSLTQLSIPNNCDVGGAGPVPTQLTFSSSQTGCLICESSLAVTNITIHDLIIDGGGGTSNGEIGVNLANAGGGMTAGPVNVLIERVVVQNVGASCFNVSGTDSTLGDRVTIRNSRCINGGLSNAAFMGAFIVDDVSDLEIANNEATGVGLREGVVAFDHINANAATPVRNVRIVNNSFHAMQSPPSCTGDLGTTIDVGRVFGVVVANNQINNSSSCGGVIFFESVWNGSIAGNVAFTSSQSSTQNMCVLLKIPDTTQSGEVSNQNISITGNTCYNPSGGAASITIQSALQGIVVSDNSIIFNTIVAQTAIYLQLVTSDANINAGSFASCENITVTNNTLVNLATLVSNATIGILLSQVQSNFVPDSIIIANNTIRGFNDGIAWNSTSASNGLTHVYIHDNGVEGNTTGTLSTDGKTLSTLYYWNNLAPNGNGIQVSLLPAMSYQFGGTVGPASGGGAALGSTSVAWADIVSQTRIVVLDGGTCSATAGWETYCGTAAHQPAVTSNGGTLDPLPTIHCTTSQKTESAADANVLTCAPISQAGSYRIRFVMSVSAANAATLGWTATWTDSNGAAQTPTNLSLFQSATALPALTFTTSAAGNYYADAQIDINNAGTGIVIKLTFSGTSFTAKVTATVERII